MPLTIEELEQRERHTILKAAQIIVDSHEHDEPDDEIDTRVQVFKSEVENGELFIEGAVLVPEVTDREGDIISDEEIRKTAYNYMRDSQRGGEMHARILASDEATLVESRIAKRSEKLGGKTIKAGSWIVKFHITSDSLKKKIGTGKYNSFSIGGRGQRSDG